jgi:6-phosphogluconolactonase
MSFHKYVYPDAAATAAACGQTIFSLLEDQLAGESTATLAISGGSTPKLMFEDMAKSEFNWRKVHIFWVDERGVPPTDSQSNYLLAEQTLLKPAGIPPSNVHRIRAELPPEEAARLYADEIREFFNLVDGQFPSFDVIHRGVGPDAHTASLFPGEPLIDDRENPVAAVFVPKMNQWRITLLPGVLLHAKHTVILACGADKEEPLRAVIHEPYDPKKYPSQLAVHDGRGVLLFLDEAAAKGLD